MRLTWVTGLDAWPSKQFMPLHRRYFARFEQDCFHAAKVRNVSRVESQIQLDRNAYSVNSRLIGE
jgi:hypothetical protein